MQADARALIEDVTARLDRLPLSSFSYKLLIMMMPAWVIEAYDIGIIGPTIAVLKPLWSPSPAQVGLLAISSTVAIAIGLIPSGLLVDRFGRRKVLIGGIVWFSIFTTLGGLSPNIEVLTLFRFLAGFGMGAVFPLPYVYLAEFLTPTARGKFVGYLNGLLTADYVVPPLTAIYMLAHYPPPVAWRLLYLVAFIPLIYAIILIFVLPESPRWLASHGKRDEVTRLLVRVEAETARSTKQPLPAVIPQRAVAAAEVHWSNIFRPPYLARTIVVWLAFMGTVPVFYVLVTYAPTLMAAQGFQLAKSLQFVAALQLLGGIGGVVQGFIGDNVGRKVAIVSYAAVALIGLLGMAFGHSLGVLLFAGLLVGFFGLGIYPVNKMFVAEQYPTPIRGFGTGATEAFGRFFGGVVFVYAVPYLAGAGGTQLVTIVVAILLFCGALLPIGLFGRETKGRSIDAGEEATPVAVPA